MKQDDILLKKFHEQNKKSKIAFENACNYLEGGTTRTSIYYRPYPFYAEKGEGCWIYDVDGNKRLDFLNNFSALIHGHAHPKINEAVKEQVEKGTALGAATECEARLASILMKRVQSLEKMRFTSSGTEAVMYCLRLAKAFTGRSKIAKFEGGFHGSYDHVLINVKPPNNETFNWDDPAKNTFSDGINPNIATEVVILPFNNISKMEHLISKYKEDLAAVIVEPIQGAAGVIPGKKDFLRSLRAITKEYGIVLIFDEIMSLRTAWGGAQEYYQITPELTAMGKIISGGFPLAGFGGREEIMELLDPREKDPLIPHSGTFNAIPICVVAGIEAMKDFTRDKYEKLNMLTDRLCRKANELFVDLGYKAQMTHGGSLFNIHFTDKKISNVRDTVNARQDLLERLFFSLLNRGIYIARRGYGCLSTPMTAKEIDVFIETLKISLTEDLSFENS